MERRLEKSEFGALARAGFRQWVGVESGEGLNLRRSEETGGPVQGWKKEAEFI